MDPLTGLAIAGTVTSLYGQYKAAQSEEEAARQNARLKEAQAAETLRRSVINADIMYRQGTAQIGSNISAKSSETSTEATSFSNLTSQYDALFANISKMKEEAEYDAELIRMGAKQDIGKAQAVASALPWQLASLGISGGYKTYQAIDANTSKSNEDAELNSVR